MNVAIYIPDTTPEGGGAYTLLQTIQNEILESSGKADNKFFFLWNGNTAEYKTEFNDFTYYNLDKLTKLSAKQKIKDNLKKIFGRQIRKENLFNLIAEKEKIDIFWFPKPVCIDIDYPYIFTVWDLGHRTTPFFPEVSRTGWSWNSREEMYQKMLFKASYVITGNNEGKKEILTNYPMAENKIRICPFPVASFCKGSEKKPDFNIPENFFFYPAQFWPHKNQIAIVNALEILRDKYCLTPTVFFTGADKGNSAYIKSEISKRNLENQVIFTGFVSDDELKYLYTHAVAMVFASLMGPNNMPPIEATYLNCPVVITDLDGHKEQLGDTAAYFNGYRPEELAEKMNILLTKPDIRSSIQKKETILAKEFEKINYFSEIQKILNEFSFIRKTWGIEYNND